MFFTLIEGLQDPCCQTCPGFVTPPSCCAKERQLYIWPRPEVHMAGPKMFKDRRTSRTAARWPLRQPRQVLTASIWFLLSVRALNCFEDGKDWRWLKIIDISFTMIDDDGRWLKMVEDDWRWLTMIEDDCRWLKMIEDVEALWRWLKMTEDDWNWLTMIEDDWSWLKMDEYWTWLRLIDIDWMWLKIIDWRWLTLIDDDWRWLKMMDYD